MMPRWLAHVIVMLVLTAGVALAFMRVDYTWNWLGVWEYRQKFIQGWVTTVGISLTALVCSSFIGIFTAFLLQAKNPVVGAIGRVYVEIVRGTPLLVQLLIGFYVVASAIGLENRFVVGILILSLFSGAYMAEIFRGGLAAIPATQRDAARSIGLSSLQTMRFVILPQAIRLVLPPVAGQLVSLIKDSSLLSVIAISEFTLAAQEVNSFTYSTLESYLPLAVGYLLLTLPLSAAGRWLEIRFKFES